MANLVTLASTPAGPSTVRPTASGPVLFARYAYGPNRFGYCGPDDADELLEAGVAGQDRVLRALAQRFEGAYPYLALIARSAGIRDPLDRRVVEAYWLGSDLLRDVPVAAFGASIDERFRERRPDEAADAGDQRRQLRSPSSLCGSRHGLPFLPTATWIVLPLARSTPSSARESS